MSRPPVPRPRPNEIPGRRTAAALAERTDGDHPLGLLPALCHRRHADACRRAVLARADRYITREVPDA